MIIERDAIKVIQSPGHWFSKKKGRGVGLDFLNLFKYLGGVVLRDASIEKFQCIFMILFIYKFRCMCMY